jgi:hypothetical protein
MRQHDPESSNRLRNAALTLPQERTTGVADAAA